MRAPQRSATVQAAAAAAAAAAGPPNAGSGAIATVTEGRGLWRGLSGGPGPLGLAQYPTGRPFCARPEATLGSSRIARAVANAYVHLTETDTLFHYSC